MEAMFKLGLLVCAIVVKVVIMMWVYQLGTSIDSSLAKMAAATQQCRLQQ